MAWGGQGGRTGPAHEPGSKGKCQHKIRLYQIGRDGLHSWYSKQDCHSAAVSTSDSTGTSCDMTTAIDA